MNLPARIGKYELEEFLGGGMSHVYRARDTVIGRTVAVKILTEKGCQDEEAKARFLAEARMAGNIEHENVLSIYDFGEDDQHRPFMVMEFLRGENLHRAIQEGHTGDMRSKLRIALQIARALEYIHSRKIVHRDIKPDNIHITTAGVVKLMDFGIAKTEGLALTRVGYILGTPYYMAPEQVQGHEVTEQVDVYAFGILLFELLTGTRPVSGDSVNRIFYSILNELVNLEPLYASGAPKAVCDLVASCTAKDPKARLQGFAPVCKEIEGALAQMDAPTVTLPEKKPEAQPPPVKRAAWVLPAVIAAVVALGGGIYFATRPKPAVVQAPGAPVKAEPAKTIPDRAGDMVLVSEGPFLFGKNKQTASLKSFYIDRTEVTNAAYSIFCREAPHDPPSDFPKDNPDFPVANVSFTDAQSFANWAGKRLPTSEEWEKAARGPNGLLFPWGNDADPAKANVGGKTLKPATDFAEGVSPYGALNMVGNVWEWVNARVTPEDDDLKAHSGLKPPPTRDEPWYTVRGLSFLNQLSDHATWDFAAEPARVKLPAIGFRCAKDAQ
jgi:serine/threonine-protein kinase